MPLRRTTTITAARPRKLCSFSERDSVWRDDDDEFFDVAELEDVTATVVIAGIVLLNLLRYI
jgi:hypothetical protein